MVRKSAPKSGMSKTSGNAPKSVNYPKKAMTKATVQMRSQGQGKSSSTIAKSMATGSKTNKPGGKKYKR